MLKVQPFSLKQSKYSLQKAVTNVIPPKHVKSKTTPSTLLLSKSNENLSGRIKSGVNIIESQLTSKTKLDEIPLPYPS